MNMERERERERRPKGTKNESRDSTRARVCVGILLFRRGFRNIHDHGPSYRCPLIDTGASAFPLPLSFYFKFNLARATIPVYSEHGEMVD